MNCANGINPTFRFKRFALSDRRCGMKIGTDGVLLGSWAELSQPTGLVADVGAGCGLISLMIAQRYALSERIYALEIEDGAFEDLQANVAASPWNERITAIKGDFRNFESVADLIVSNPPFFVTGHHSPLQSRAMARHGTNCGLSPISLIAFAATRLKPKGRLAMIFPPELLHDVEMEAALQRLEFSRLCEVITCHGKAPSRIMAELSPTASKIERSRLVIRNADNRFSPEYIALSDQFYIDIKQ